jgi:ectoine hydroxylase-related dioxygenase (phytanoyl-CoA dioxygenase family)
VVLNTMWALDDFTPDNGPTRFVPGSHRWGRGGIPDREPTTDDPIEHALMPAGSVAFYVGTIWHGGGANRTDQPRHGVILEYVAAWLRAQETHLLAVPRETVATLPERLQELLGYNIYPPFVGYVDGRHPRRYILEPVRPGRSPRPEP